MIARDFSSEARNGPHNAQWLNKSHIFRQNSTLIRTPDCIDPGAPPHQTQPNPTSTLFPEPLTVSDVASLNSLIKDVADLGCSVKNIEVDEDERGLILRVPRTDGPFDITMPEHLHLDPEDFDEEQGCISEKADMRAVRAFWNAISRPCSTTTTARGLPTSGRCSLLDEQLRPLTACRSMASAD